MPPSTVVAKWTKNSCDPPVSGPGRRPSHVPHDRCKKGWRRPYGVPPFTVVAKVSKSCCDSLVSGSGAGRRAGAGGLLTVGPGPPAALHGRLFCCFCSDPSRGRMPRSVIVPKLGGIRLLQAPGTDHRAGAARRPSGRCRTSPSSVGGKMAATRLCPAPDAGRRARAACCPPQSSLAPVCFRRQRLTASHVAFSGH